MKSILKYAVVAVFALLATTGCFKPDDDGRDENANLLEGYWEITHITDNDYYYSVYSDGTQSEKEYDHFDSEVVCNDGQEEYSVLRFTEALMTLVATDSQEDVENLNIPMPYTLKDGKLYSPIFVDPEANVEYVEVLELTNTTLKIKLDEYYKTVYDDEGGYEPNRVVEYHECLSRITTFKKID